ncbi:MAG TPA: PVC-type heme-binding CxxCH protein [Gemmataceae bacterium]|nr:PVC-type heme-binding CxxCH protein [Gemmataceae bacterium]
MRFTPSICLALVFASPALAQPYIAPTEALSPADEQKALKVPDGFEVQLVASEPQIQKPIQMCFDAKGRLWVTTSHHYPFAAPKGEAHDKLFVLSDFGPDGKAAKVTVFADFLNIPIGILPLPDCNSCIVSSAGEILKLTDTDGDGKADKTEVLFTGFGTRDTHGMYNSYTLLPDGWVYACHGYLNDSTVKGKDGHEVKMNSGNTFRFRPDGSRIEVVSRGQVNPFGMTVDPWFNLYTADCHSKPITQIIPGAYYDSFGKPHDGLGYAPHVAHHDHGSTALCGLSWYDADQFPKEYKGCMFLGNVVTNRVNFDRIEWKGSTPVAIEQPDFVVSKDPWFRPADIKLGPDGALYVTDFYNRIIGHYEVPLTHPLRDKDRGRIWRIVWKGKDGSAPPPKMPGDLTKKPVEELVEVFGAGSTATRLQVTNELVSRVRDGRETWGSVARSFNDPAKPGSHGNVTYWMIAAALQPGDLPPDTLVALSRTAAKNDLKYENGSVAVVHLLRVMAATKDWKADPHLHSEVRSWLVYADPHIRLAAAEAVISHPHPEFVQPLIELIEKTPAEDTHLRHAARIALRNCVAAKDGWKAAPEASATIADVSLGIPTTESAAYLAKFLAAKGDVSKLSETVEHIARYGADADRDAVVKFAQDAKEWRKRHTVVLALRKGVAARGQPLRPAEQTLAAEVALTGLADKDPAIVQASCELAGSMKLAPARPMVLDIANDQARPEPVRISALAAVLAIDPNAAIPVLVSAVNDNANPPGLRERAGQLLGSVNTPDGIAATRAALKTAPYRVTVGLAAGLAGSKSGAEALLAAVKAGEASPRLLQEKVVIEKLRTSGVPDLDTRVGELTKGLPPADAKIAQLIKTRSTEFAAAKPDKELGAKLYAKHCAACHQIGGQGGKVGPNLDGIGGRGLDRLLEDILDPNRNVDQAFRARVLNLTDGTTKTGLKLRVEGEVMVMADDQGKEFRVPLKDIEKERETNLSPMPANFGEVIPAADFPHLMAYLLDQKAKEKK